MRGCKQATITNTAFIHLRGVQTLIMAGCKQATITVAAFLRLRGIQKVNMVGCNQAIPSQMRPSCICAGSALSTPMCAPPPWRLQPLVSSPCCLSPTGRTTRACWLLLQSRSDGSFASEQKRRIAEQKRRIFCFRAEATDCPCSELVRCASVQNKVGLVNPLLHKTIVVLRLPISLPIHTPSFLTEAAAMVSTEFIVNASI